MSCPTCEQPFHARDVRQVYCSASCRVMACQRRKRTERDQWQAKHWLPDPLPAAPPWPAREVPVAIVAHPSRTAHLDALVQQTTAEAVILDDRNYGCEVNHLRAWEWLGGGNCGWSVVIEDDALPVAKFRYQLHAALGVARTPIVSLYLGKQRPPHWQTSVARAIGAAQLHDVCFFRATALLHAVGYAIRTALIPDLLGDLPARVKTTPIDEAITAWARDRGHPISYTWPSLVDHRDETPLVDHPDRQGRTKGRTAWCADWRQDWKPTLGDIAEPARRREAG